MLYNFVDLELSILIYIWIFSIDEICMKKGKQQMYIEESEEMKQSQRWISFFCVDFTGILSSFCNVLS